LIAILLLVPSFLGTETAKNLQKYLPAFLPVQAWVPRQGGARAPSIPIVYLRLAL